MPVRQHPVAPAVCLAAVGLFYPFASAQTPGGNPIDTLPVPQLPSEQKADPSITILPSQLEAQPRRSLNVTPQRFQIEGVQSIDFDEVAGLFKPLAGQTVTVARIAEVSREVTALYKQRGYALSFAFVPEQDFKDGVVRIVAVEGYVATVKIEGDPGLAEAKLREIAVHLQQDRPLRLASFERYTQLMAQMPGLRVEASATPPATTDGAGTLLLKVVRQPYLVALATDVRGSRPRVVATGVLNDPFTGGSRLTASTLIGALKGEHFGAASYSQVVGSEGLTLKAEMSIYRGNPDAALDTPPLIQRETDYKRLELSAQYPLILTRSESLYLSGGIYGVGNADNYANPANGVMLTDEVNVRAVYAQASYTHADDNQAQSLSLRLTHGLTSLGAGSSIRANVPGPLPTNPARLDFTRLLVEGSQRNRWGKNWGTAVTALAQYTPHSLPSTERVSFGSSKFARAYAAGEVSGDSGWGIGLEVNRSFALDTPYLRQVSPYVLLEGARVTTKTGTFSPSKLWSASLGVRISDNKYYSLDVAASKPLGDASPSNPDRKIRLSALVSYNFGQP
ncbi:MULTISPECIES: ShlB/FhaC/HecB family hemolysin secretion/activation protein [unclassified Polaromonas]|uniref:ShlB/FhaC/HecB family hemolysin secretion/activation protein n=1 Tax=unclassified Polaromonas TaxID=2638319 RepID=UPI000F084718|nr:MULTISPECIES: POTRA domain-containing protein [unclassified Polaromonas]AYQ29229.1 ShlB/FhaC/HecB family hemolysin secretion/activation protein [Polaromonas sp. SP1]QGJ19658.1 ShlB/FhaC/HecB family hemolysin secretion/activation protein [Polaromonas sp. Pch-P]